MSIAVIARHIDGPSGQIYLKSFQPQEPVNEIVFCHGGGHRPMVHYEELSQELAGHQIACHIFDFPGHGKSGGHISKQSLAARYSTLRSVLDHLDSGSVALAGFSMGADTVIRCAAAGEYDINTAIVGAPAAYSANSFELKFTTEFTAEIKRPQSWESSVLFGLWESLDVPNYLLIPEKDAVIPQAITEQYRLSSSQERIIHLSGFSHGIADSAVASTKSMCCLVDQLVAILVREPQP